MYWHIIIRLCETAPFGKDHFFVRALRGKRLDWYCSAIVGKVNLYYATAAHSQSCKSPAFTEKA